jgi:ribonuclease Z
MRSFCRHRLVNGPFGDPAFYLRLVHRREALLFDCGDLQLLTPRERLKISTVFVSHCHIDHLVGFDSLLRQFLYQDAQLTICGPPGIIARVGARLSGYSWNLLDQLKLVLRVREWGEQIGREALFPAAEAFVAMAPQPVPTPNGLLYSSGSLQVRGIPLTHGDLTSLAFVLDEPLRVAIHPDQLAAAGLRPGPWLTIFKERLQRGELDGTIPALTNDGGVKSLALAELAPRIAHTEPGCKICYVTDVAPTAANLDRIVALAAGADLLVIEAVFAAAESTRAFQRHHLTSILAGETARRAGVQRLLTFHYSPRYLDRPLLLDDEAQAAFRAAPGTRNGKCV